MPDASQIQYIDTPDALDAFAAKLANVDWIALDTEFIREKTYYPKLCLLQIATPDVVACIDPLALDDLSPLLDVIFDKRVTKVMHACRQDLEIFYHLRGTVPAPIFDSQVAALLLGYPDQVGYGNLVNQMLGVSLDKKHTRADWSKRPLSEEQIRYAADDVIYLVEIYMQMHEKLGDLGRLEWLHGDFEQLTNPDLYQNIPDRAWLKVKGGNRLKGTSLAVLQALAGWREARAQDKDIPKGWLLRDDLLIELARHQPKTPSSLADIRGVSEKTVKNSGGQLLGIIAAAVKKSPTPFPGKDSRQRLSPAQDALVDVMMAVVRISGEKNLLNPAVLASRKQLEKMVAGDADSGLGQGWRKALVGDQLQALLEGKLALAVHNGELVLQD